MYRILVVDDEELIRRSIMQKLRRSNIPIALLLEAGSGKEAYRLAQKERLDIVLCDIRMGDTNGLSLCHQLLQLYPELKIVIISGYNHFDYARKALQLSAVDFLLKPVDAYELYHSVNLCIELIKKEHRGRTPFDGSNYSRAQELQKLLEECVKVGAEPENEIFPKHTGTAYASMYIYFTSQACGDTISLWYDRLTGILEDWDISPLGRLAIASADSGLLLMAAASNGLAENWEEAMGQALGFLCERLSTYGPYDYTIGYSGPCRQLRDSIAKATEAMKARVLYEGNNLIDWHMLQERQGRYSLDSKTVLSLQYALRTGRFDMVGQILTGIHREFTRVSASYLSCRNLYLQLQLLVGEELGDTSAFVGRELYSFPSVKAMLDLFQSLFLEFSTRKSKADRKPKEDLVDQAKLFLDEHLSEPVTLEQVADLLHISAGYLSIIFKEVAGINFQEYLMCIRVERAKQLLQQGCYQIKDVACMSGFNNQHYFSKVFKRLTSLTPREYRETFYTHHSDEC